MTHTPDDIDVPDDADTIDERFAGIHLKQIQYVDGTTAYRTSYNGDATIESPTVGELVEAYGKKIQEGSGDA